MNPEIIMARLTYVALPLSLSLSLSPAREVQNWVANTQSEHRPFVGKPTEEETRKALVEAKGKERDAVDIIYKERKQKVKWCVCVCVCVRERERERDREML